MMLTTHFRDVRKSPGACEYGFTGRVLCLSAHIQCLKTRISALSCVAAERAGGGMLFDHLRGGIWPATWRTNERHVMRCDDGRELATPLGNLQRQPDSKRVSVIQECGDKTIGKPRCRDWQLQRCVTYRNALAAEVISACHLGECHHDQIRGFFAERNK